MCSAVTHLLHQMQHQQSFRQVSSSLAVAGDDFSKSLLIFVEERTGNWTNDLPLC